MAIIRSLDESGDFVFGRGNANYIQGIHALKQNLETRLLEHANDWFLDYGSGINYDFFLSNKGQKESLENAIKTQILQTKEVREIIDFKFGVTNRDMSITAVVNSIDGVITLNIVI